MWWETKGQQWGVCVWAESPPFIFSSIHDTVQNSNSQVRDLKQPKLSQESTSGPQECSTLIDGPGVCDGEKYCPKEVEVSLTERAINWCAGKPIDGGPARVLISILFRLSYWCVALFLLRMKLLCVFEMQIQMYLVPEISINPPP